MNTLGLLIKYDIEKVVDKALDEMPDNFIIKKFLLAHRAEVKGMFLTEYNEEKTLQQERQEGIQEANERVATNMLRAGEPLEKIITYSSLAKDVIASLANSLGIAVVR